MILPLLLAVPAIATQDRPAAMPEDVVVIGERMRQLKLSTKTDRKTGTVRCIVRRSSGDPSFDARLCEATRNCAATARTEREMTACVTPYVSAYAREVNERRHAAAASAETTPRQEPSP